MLGAAHPGPTSLRLVGPSRVRMAVSPGSSDGRHGGDDRDRKVEAVPARQLEAGLDIAATNADGTTELPMPAVLLVDSDRVVRWIDVHPNYATRTEPAEILAALDARSS